MRPSICAAILLLILAPITRAQDAAVVQVDAARSDALDALRREILATQILPDATVQYLVDRAGGEGVVSKLLTTAQQVGGPRWIDDQTCQVTLSVDGDQFVKALVDLAQSKPKALSVPPATLRDRLKRWNHRTLQSVGTSIGWAGVDRLRPDAQQAAWQNVGDEERRKAIRAAKEAAVQAVLDSIKPVQLEGAHTLAEALALPGVDEDLRKWISGRPITAVQFRDNREVRLALSVAPQELWPILKETLQKQKGVPVPTRTVDWVRVREQTLARMAPPVGASIAIVAANAPVNAVVLPQNPPAWVNDAIEAQAASGPAGSALRTARAAEVAASRELRAQVNALRIAPGVTLGDAARQDPHVETALARAVERAQIAKVDYDLPTRGSVRAKLTLNLEDVWRELAAR